MKFGQLGIFGVCLYLPIVRLAQVLVLPYTYGRNARFETNFHINFDITSQIVFSFLRSTVTKYVFFVELLEIALNSRRPAQIDLRSRVFFKRDCHTY